MSSYAFDHDFNDVLAIIAASASVDWSDPEAIKASRTGGRLSVLSGVPKGDPTPSEDRIIAGLDGDPDVGVRIYRPSTPMVSPGPGIVFIHGGGFMTGTVDQSAAMLGSWVESLGIVIASVDYRLAPEDPYPAGIHDCYAALVWLAANAEGLGIDPDRIAIAGPSAGAGLAAGTALMARDRGGPALCYQLLQIPEIDDRLETWSMRTFTDTPIWNRPSAEWSWKHYLGDLYGSDDVPYYAAPSRCEDLSGLPPTFVATMEFDPLRDEGIDYAVRLMQAGVSVELHSFPGTFHGSAMVPGAGVSNQDARITLNALRKAFGLS